MVGSSHSKRKKRFVNDEHSSLFYRCNEESEKYIECGSQTAINYRYLCVSYFYNSSKHIKIIVYSVYTIDI
jgi:hypothetical protein